MPIYSIQCKCGHKEDVYRSLAEYDNLPYHCYMKMTRAVCAPMVIADIHPYRSMQTGEYIQSRSQHRSHLKQHGLIEVGNEKIENKQPEYKSPDLKADIAQAVHQVLG